MLAPRWRVVALALVAVMVPALGACSADPATPAPSSTPASATATLATLPDSVLVPVTGVAYVNSSTARASLALTHVASTLTVFDAQIAREMTSGSTVVGGVQVYRLAPGPASVDHSWYVPMMLYELSGTSPTTAQIGGMKVDLATAASDGTSYVGWSQSGHVILLWADDATAAHDYAARWILGGFSTATQG